MIAKQMSREGDVNIGIGLRGIYYDTKTHYQCLYCDKVLTKANKARHSKVCVQQPDLQEQTVTQVLNEVFGKPSPLPAAQTKACSCFVCDKTIPLKALRHTQRNTRERVHEVNLPLNHQYKPVTTRKKQWSKLQQLPQLQRNQKHWSQPQQNQRLVGKNPKHWSQPQPNQRLVAKTQSTSPNNKKTYYQWRKSKHSA